MEKENLILIVQIKPGYSVRFAMSSKDDANNDRLTSVGLESFPHTHSTSAS